MGKADAFRHSTVFEVGRPGLPVCQNLGGGGVATVALKDVTKIFGDGNS